MKLKFRADPKDWTIFAVFSLFLFYLSAIIVLNMASFASEGVFHGLNPFPAFSEAYFAPTMVIFIGALLALIMSVSSHFFDREKGVGFSSATKKENNYARWASEKEIKKELTKINPLADHNEAGGIPIIMNKKEVWVDNGGYHNLIIGSTGAGKTQTTVFPMVKNLSKHDESMIITDPKGEIYEDTAEMLRERGYNIILLNFRDPQQGNSWNPLSLPYQLYREGNTDKATEILDDLGLNILYDESAKSQDPFWEKTSADYFAGLSQALFEDATEEQINLNSINLMTSAGEDKFMGTNYMKEYFSHKNPTSPAYINVASTINAPTETKGSILSVFRQKIKLFATRENLSEMLSHSDFDMKEIGRKKTAVFIVIQDEKKTYHSLVTIFLKQCYETLISVAQESGGKLPHRTNFILDEFANMPPLKDVTTMVTAARSRNIRFNFIIQNFSQLYEVYGKEQGETIKGNCGNIVYLISSEISALEEISKMCGEVKSKEKEKTSSTPLVTVSDLQRLKMWNIIVLRIRMMPFKTTLTPNFEMNWGKEYPKASYPQRQKKPVQVFDIKKFVEAAKEKKMRELLGDNPAPGGAAGMSSPFGMSMPSMPPKPISGGSMPNFNPIPNMGNSPGAFQGTTSLPVMPDMSSLMSENSDNGAGGFDVDDLIKRIDAKIAELEEEERQEKLKAEGGMSQEEPASTIPAPIMNPSTEKPMSNRPQVPNELVNMSNVENVQVSTFVPEPVLEQTKVEPKVEPMKPVDFNPVIVSQEAIGRMIQDMPETTVLDMPREQMRAENVEIDPAIVKEKPVPSKPISVKMPTIPSASIMNDIKVEQATQTVDQSMVSKKEQPEIPIPKTQVVPAKPVQRTNDYITDDQFFDDFFADEDE